MFASAHFLKAISGSINENNHSFKKKKLVIRIKKLDVLIYVQEACSV